MASGAHERVVVVGADLMSSIIDPLDRTTAVLFGDGAGAALLERAEPGYGILDFYHRVDGSGRDDLMMPAGGSLLPPSIATVTARQHFLKQNGRAVFKFAVTTMVESVQILLERNGLTPSDIAMVVPHQANQRILDATAERLGVPHERVASVLARYGNTTGATLPLALDGVLSEGKIKRGDLVVFTAVGAGFTSGATLVRWALAERLRPRKLRRRDGGEIGVAQVEFRRADAVEGVLDGARAGDDDHRQVSAPVPTPAPAHGE